MDSPGMIGPMSLHAKPLEVSVGKVGFIGSGTLTAAVVRGLRARSSAPTIHLSPRSEALSSALAREFVNVVGEASNSAVVAGGLGRGWLGGARRGERLPLTPRWRCVRCSPRPPEGHGREGMFRCAGGLWPPKPPGA